MLIVVCRTKVSKDIYLCQPQGFAMSKSLLTKFGQKVREERLNRGFSQEELALKAGVHRTYIGMIERGEKNITLLNIEKIAKSLDITISELTNL